MGRERDSATGINALVKLWTIALVRKCEIASKRVHHHDDGLLEGASVETRDSVYPGSKTREGRNPRANSNTAASCSTTMVTAKVHLFQSMLVCG